MPISYIIREFLPEDTAAVNNVAAAAFAEYQPAYSDWPTFSSGIAQMSELASKGEIIVATTGVSIIGAVAYVGPGKPKATFFAPAWPIIRMLVVPPAFRGHGLGRALTNECIRRARRDNANCIALHTTPIMKVALPMYQRMGFEFLRDAPSIFGVPYGVYVKRLAV